MDGASLIKCSLNPNLGLAKTTKIGTKSTEILGEMITVINKTVDKIIQTISLI